MTYLILRENVRDPCLVKRAETMRISSERHDLEPGLGPIVERLERQFQCFDSDTITEVVRECAARFEGAPVQNYVFVLVERLARIRLQTPVA